MTLYDKVKQLGAERSLNMTRLSYKTEISHTTFKNMKTKRVSLETIRRLGEALDLTSDEIKELTKLNEELPNYKGVK